MQKLLETNVYAGFFVRWVAFAIDSLLAAIIVGIASLPLSLAANGGASFLAAEILFDYSLIDIFKYIATAAYFVILTYFSHATLGKMILHLEVVTIDKEWTFLNILYRETIGRFLSSLLYIGYLVVLGTRRKQGFHDMLCDTGVVYKDMMAKNVVRQVPDMRMPAQQMPMQQVPGQQMSRQQAPMQQVPGQQMPGQQAPMQPPTEQVLPVVPIEEQSQAVDRQKTVQGNDTNAAEE